MVECFVVILGLIEKSILRYVSQQGKFELMSISS